jgi:hypothetical protein
VGRARPAGEVRAVTEPFSVPVRDSVLGKTSLRVLDDAVVLEGTKPNGTTTFRFPRPGVATADLAGLPDPGNPVDDRLFADPLVLVPIMDRRRPPNFALLLAEPGRYAFPSEVIARLPLAEMVTSRHDRRVPGLWVDGVLLSVDHPAVIAAALADLGVETVSDPAFWYAARRQVLNPEEAARADAANAPTMRRRRQGRLVIAAGTGLGVAGIFATPWLLLAGAAVAAGGSVLAHRATVELRLSGWRPRG